MKSYLVAFGSVAVLAASASFPRPVDERVAAVTNYRHWSQATAKAVQITPELWMLCRPPTPQEQKDLDDFNKKNPHSNGYIRIYMNDLAKGPLLHRTSFPPGSMLVKEKMIGPDTGLVARTVMRKHEKGWNPKTGDWEFYVLSKDMQLEPGKEADCISCHKSQAKRGWVYRTYLGQDRGVR